MLHDATEQFLADPETYCAKPSPGIFCESIARSVGMNAGFYVHVNGKDAFVRLGGQLGEALGEATNGMRPMRGAQPIPQNVVVRRMFHGKLIAINSTASLKDVTVLVQAKKEGDAVWRIAAACNTDAFGNFVMPYPYGQYVAAQAVVALTPNSPADIPVHTNDDNDECIADDFLYLLIKDVPAPEEETQAEGDDGT